MAPEFAIARRLFGVVFAAEGDKPIAKHVEEALAFFSGCLEGIAHDAMLHLAAALGEERVFLYIGTEVAPPFILDCEIHIDKVRTKKELEAGFPLAAMTDAAVVGLAPGEQFIGCHVPVGERQRPDVLLGELDRSVPGRSLVAAVAVEQ